MVNNDLERRISALKKVGDSKNPGIDVGDGSSLPVLNHPIYEALRKEGLVEVKSVSIREVKGKPRSIAFLELTGNGKGLYQAINKLQNAYQDVKERLRNYIDEKAEELKGSKEIL